MPKGVYKRGPGRKWTEEEKAAARIPKTKPGKLAAYGVTQAEFDLARDRGQWWCSWHKRFESGKFGKKGNSKLCYEGRREKEQAIYDVERSLKRLYKKSPEWYAATLVEQGGHCALCPATKGSSDGHTHLWVDHSHKCCNKSRTCGKCVRGLLCRRCNYLIGQLETLMQIGLVPNATPGTWAERALAYLKSYEKPLTVGL